MSFEPIHDSGSWQQPLYKSRMAHSQANNLQDYDRRRLSNKTRTADEMLHKIPESSFAGCRRLLCGQENHSFLLIFLTLTRAGLS